MKYDKLFFSTDSDFDNILTNWNKSGIIYYLLKNVYQNLIRLGYLNFII